MNLGCALSVPTWVPRKLGLGPERLLDGLFGDGSPWSAGVGWVIEDNAASRLPSNLVESAVSQPIAFVAGSLYRVTYTVAAYPVGSVFTPSFFIRFSGGTAGVGATRTAVGTYSETIQANSGNNTFNIVASISAVASISNVSVREVMT